MTSNFSLTVRLAVAFAFTGFLTLYSVGTYLERELSERLLSQDDSEIVLKAQHMRDLLLNLPPSLPIGGTANTVKRLFDGNTPYLIQVRDASGNILINLDPSGLSGKTQQIVATSVTVNIDNIQALGTGILPIRGISVRLLLSNGEHVSLIVARSMLDREVMISSYREIIVGAMLVGTFILMVLGYFLVRHAIRPLKHMATQAALITASSLDSRLCLEDPPLELADLAGSLNAMLARLDDGFCRLSEFTTDLAHDLRTPITNLRGQTEVALSRARDVGEYQALLVSNLEEYQRLNRMIESILFLARADNAQIALHPIKIDLEPALQQIGDYFADLAEDSGLSFDIQAAGVLKADVILFRRAIHNLVSNALKHTAPGGVIQMKSGIAGEMSFVSVTNPGADIDPVHLANLFQRFYRADASRSNSAESTGLGLSIVRSIMELHGGKYAVASNGGLTTFSLYFPALRDC